MKIRSGFVSNSSSSSFCVYGAEISNYKEILFKKSGIGEKYGISCEQCNLSEIGESIKDLEASTCNSEGESLYVGRCYTTLKDDETGKQFRDDVKQKIKDLIGEEVKCSHIEIGWYNG